MKNKTKGLLAKKSISFLWAVPTKSALWAIMNVPWKQQIKSGKPVFLTAAWSRP